MGHIVSTLILSSVPTALGFLVFTFVSLFLDEVGG